MDINTKPKVYYSRGKYLWRTPQENRDILLLLDLGFDVINNDMPDIVQNHDPAHGHFWENLIENSKILAFRRFPDGKIGAGVYSEIQFAAACKLPVIELPTIFSGDVHTIDDTREFFKYVGQR